MLGEMNMNTDIFNKESMKLFFLLCCYFLFSYVLYTICKLVKFQNCLGLIQILSISIPLIIYLIKMPSNKNICKFGVIGVYLFLLIILPFLYNKTYDLTIDGNSYHKTAIAFIKNGWNPYYESSTDFQERNSDIVKFDKKTKINLWIEHYPKASWISAAIIYNMTNNIESGKCITLIFSIMLLIIAYNCLKIIISRKWAIFISILLVLNPITLSQFFTYYVDSIMGIMFVIELLLLLLVNPMSKINKKLWICIISICTIFSNLKYTGLLYSGIIAAVFYFYWVIKYRKYNEFFNYFKSFTLAFIITFVTAIFIVGSSSYVKNTIDHHNPLYPIIGNDKVDIVTTMQPKSFKTKSMGEKFLLSIFSKTENVTYYSGDPKLKLPFKVYPEEIEQLMLPDVRIGGFGPLFALALIICVILFIRSTIIFIKYENNNLKYIVLPFISIVLTMILVGENWWARYIPQLYLLIVGSILLMVYCKKYKDNIFCKISILLASIVVLLNARYFINNNNELLKSFKNINNDLTELENREHVNLKLSTDGLYGYIYNLNDRNINYNIVKKIDEKKIKYIYSWRMEVEQE